MIRMTGIHFIRENRHILRNVDLRIQQGEHWVILGRNGSGKTTLLEMMNGYLFPSMGTVEVLGHRYGTVDIREIRKQIGYISQSLLEKLNLNDPVWEVVATGAYAFLRFYQAIPQDARDKALAILEKIGLSYTANQPLGTLSQGERKKVMLARSLMAEPAILILDEPCSGLDLYEREKLLGDIEQLAAEGGPTMVYVTHHIEEIMPVFTHIALLEQGRIVSSGSKLEVLTPEQLLEAYQVNVHVDWWDNRPWVRTSKI